MELNLRDILTNLEKTPMPGVCVFCDKHVEMDYFSKLWFAIFPPDSVCHNDCRESVKNKLSFHKAFLNILERR